MIVRNDPSRLQVLDHKVGKRAKDTMEALEKCMVNNEEGLIIKDPQSLYKPHTKLGDWFKFKADFIDGLGDDLDLLIVGGYYGQGFKGGRLASFLCAVKDDSASPRYIAFCKFGGGFSMDELPSISLEGQGNWKKFDKTNPPTWLELPASRDFPDMVIEPEFSHIVQVRGTALVSSSTFPTGITVRFPRYVKLRSNEKSVHDCMSRQDLIEYYNRNRGSMQFSNASSLLEEGPSPAKKRLKDSPSRRILSNFVGVDASSLQPVTDLFKDTEFCVFLKTNPDFGYRSKPEVERAILQHGGSITQHPSKSTKFIVADQPTVKVNNQKARHDVVKSAYIFDCIAADRLLQLTPAHYLHASSQTTHLFRNFVDDYGDSFTQDVDIEGLKNVDHSSSPGRWEPGELLEAHLEAKRCISELNHEYFPDSPQYFAPCVIYLDSYSKIVIAETLELEPQECHHWTRLRLPESCSLPWQLLCSTIRLYGGTVVDRVTAGTTHIISDDSSSFRVHQLQAKVVASGGCRARVVNRGWIQESVRIRGLADEGRFQIAN
ncbi:DNA ligase (ATP) [Kappamyces sp. JEL0680]|nr:DNA ligase (ATP) [Kappamyces sp. JEL0680]